MYCDVVYKVGGKGEGKIQRDTLGTHSAARCKPTEHAKKKVQITDTDIQPDTRVEGRGSDDQRLRRRGDRWTAAAMNPYIVARTQG